MSLFDDLASAFKNASGNRPNNNNRARDLMKADFQGGRTVYCKGCGKQISEAEAQADHIFPRSKGGPDAAWNVQPLCAPCNRAKSDKVDGRVVEGYAKKIQDNFRN